jgi:hypothetical protein
MNSDGSPAIPMTKNVNKSGGYLEVIVSEMFSLAWLNRLIVSGFVMTRYSLLVTRYSSGVVSGKSVTTLRDSKIVLQRECLTWPAWHPSWEERWRGCTGSRPCTPTWFWTNSYCRHVASESNRKSTLTLDRSPETYEDVNRFCSWRRCRWPSTRWRGKGRRRRWVGNEWMNNDIPVKSVKEIRKFWSFCKCLKIHLTFHTINATRGKK